MPKYWAVYFYTEDTCAATARRGGDDATTRSRASVCHRRPARRSVQPARTGR
jgi:hypothetical protein